MADNKYLGKTAPDLSRSNVYDSAGDGKTFHLNEIPKWRLGNSYSAGFDYFSNAGENIAEISESRKPTGSYNNRAFERSTKSLSATQDTKTAVSSSTRLDQSADYTDDASSSSSNGGNRQEEQMLTWRKMLLDPLTAGQFLSKQWPRISLRASYKRKEPYVTPDEEDADLELEKEENDIKRRRKCTIFAIISGILLVVIAIIPVIVITSLQKDEDSSKLYVIVNMTVKVDRTLTQTLADSGSQDYNSFTDGFCYEIGKVYITKAYQGCKVSSLKNGSIIVNYIIYFTGIPVTDAANEFEMILNNYLNESSSRLGPFVINPPIVVYSVSVESLTAPPTVQGETAPNSVSSSVDLSLIETSRIISTLESTSRQSQIMSSSITDYLPTMETTMQSTESLQSKQQTTKNSFSSPLETSNFATISTTVPIAQTESVTLIESSMQTLILSSENSMSADQDQLFTTMSEYSESESNSFELSTSNSFGYTPTDALSNEISSISDTSVDITTMVEMTMTSSGLSSQTDNMQTFSPTDQTMSLERTVTPADDTLSTAALTNETTASTILLTDESTLPITTTGITQTTDGNIFETNTTPETTSSPDNTTTLSMTTNTTEKETPISQTSGPTTTYSITFTPESNSTSDIISSTEAMSTNATEATSLTSTTSPNTSVSDDSTQVSTGPETGITTPSIIETTSDNTKSTGKENASITSLTTEEETSTVTTVTMTTTMEGSTADKTTPTPTAYKSTTENPTMETTDLLSTEQTSSSTESQSFVLSCTNITANLYSGPEIMTCTIGNAYDYNQIGIKLGNTSSPLFAARVFRNGSTEVEPGHPDITVYFDKSTTLTLTFRNISDEIFGIYDILLINSLGVEIAETQGVLSALIHVSDILCDNELKAALCSGSEVVMRCNFKAPEQTINILIGIYHDDGFNDTDFGINLYLNGTVHRSLAPNENIDVSIFNEDITITFKNISSTMDGYYHVSLIEINPNSDEINELSTSKTYLNATRPPDNPTLKLNPDQVIGLEFDDNFYRAGFTHICEGNVGHPPKHWVIDIMYSTQTEFTNIPDGNIKIVSSINKSIECGTTQRMEFAILFNEEMDGGKLRCRISENVDSSDLGSTVSDQLMLIPRNYCLCAEVNERLEHPIKCDVYVECIEDGPKKYAFGKACENTHCTNSEIGSCSHNCSSTCSKDTLDYLDFCPTSLPPAKQSANVYCNGSSMFENTGPANIVCGINVTKYDVITVTFRASTDIIVLAYIDSEGKKIDTNETDGISIKFETNTLTISVQNVTCFLVGYYGVDVNVSSNVTETAEGELTILKKPNGNATLNLHPDQFADLETGHRNWLQHSCTANVGSPAGSIEIEILKQEDHQYRNLNVTVYKITDESVSCSIVQTVNFGISFTSDMEKAVIRCRTKHELFPEDPVIYSNNETVSLLEKDFCENNTDNLKYFQHPTNCNSFIQCQTNVTYSLPCQTKEHCFGLESKRACGYCKDVTCKSTTDSITTASPIEQSKYISCNDTSTLIYSETVQMACFLNKTTFSSINITFRMTGSSDDIPIADIQENGEVIYLNVLNNITISLESEILTITVHNASCANDGTFNLVLNTNGESKPPSSGQITILTKPNGTPILQLDPDQIEGLTTPRYDRLHSCNASVGKKAGEITVEILLEGAENFQTVIPEYMATPIDTTSNCMITRTLHFWVHFTTAMNNASIRCSVTNNQFPTDPTIYSIPQQLFLIPNDFCNINYNGTHNYKHPADCNRFVNCNNKIVYGKQCKTEQECFNPQIEVCDNCGNVASCP